MPVCRVCGEENPERARFCLACGEALPEQPTERFRRVVTILFSDVVDSTGLGERLDPETLDQVIDLVEVLLVAGRREEAIPIVIDALERYERKEVLPAAARARTLLDELTAGTAANVGS